MIMPSFYGFILIDQYKEEILNTDSFFRSDLVNNLETVNGVLEAYCQDTLNLDGPDQRYIGKIDISHWWHRFAIRMYSM